MKSKVILSTNTVLALSFLVLAFLGCGEKTPNNKKEKKVAENKSIVPANFEIPDFLEKYDHDSFNFSASDFFKSSKSFDEVAKYVEDEVKSKDWTIFNESRTEDSLILQFCKIDKDKIVDGVIEFADLEESFTVMVRPSRDFTKLIFTRIDRAMQAETERAEQAKKR